MQEFALYRDGSFVEVRRFVTKPENLPHKGLKWYSVGATQEGSPAGWKIKNGKAVKIVSPPPPPPTPTLLEKTTLLRRMTSSEVGQMLAALGAHPDLKMSELYRATATFDVNSTEFPVLKAAFEQVLGTHRAAEILEPEF